MAVGNPRERATDPVQEAAVVAAAQAIEADLQQTRGGMIEQRVVADARHRRDRCLAGFLRHESVLAAFDPSQFGREALLLGCRLLAVLGQALGFELQPGEFRIERVSRDRRDLGVVRRDRAAVADLGHFPLATLKARLGLCVIGDLGREPVDVFPHPVNAVVKLEHALPLAMRLLDQLDRPLDAGQGLVAGAL